MSREIFGSIVDRPARHPSPVGLPLSVAVHVLILLVVVVIPLVATDVLPEPRMVIAWMEAPPPPLPPAAPPPAPAPPPAGRALDAAAPAAPVEAPTGVGRETGIEPVRDVPVDSAPGSLGLVPGGADAGMFLPPPQPPAPVRPVEPHHVGGQIRAPEKIRDVPPVYPALAQAAHVEGVVIIEAVIDTNGYVQDARVLRSVALLDDAALAAVRQWRFTPTLLNGIPVPVIYTVTVRFALK